jgi:hypothetical protein
MSTPRPLQSLINFFRRTKIAMALLIAIGLALFMTVFSVTIYISSGVSTLDLSRPGYERVREQIGESGPMESFSSNGPLNPEVIDEFLELYDGNLERLENTNDFSDSNLKDIRERMLRSTSSDNN